MPWNQSRHPACWSHTLIVHKSDDHPATRLTLYYIILYYIITLKDIVLYILYLIHDSADRGPAAAGPRHD
jgi:hypothetical protein